MEIEIIKFLQGAKSSFFDVFFGTFTYLGGFLGFVILFFVLFYYSKKYSIVFGCSYAIIMLINTLLKIIINRARPYEIDNEIISVITASGRSFPSGHMASATVIAIFALYYVYRKIKNKNIKILSTCVGLIFLMFVAISRMYLGQHFLSDIVAGFCLGVFLSITILMLCNKIYKNICKQKQK